MGPSSIDEKRADLIGGLAILKNSSGHVDFCLIMETWKKKCEEKEERTTGEHGGFGCYLYSLYFFLFLTIYSLACFLTPRFSTEEVESDPPFLYRKSAGEVLPPVLKSVLGVRSRGGGPSTYQLRAVLVPVTLLDS